MEKIFDKLMEHNLNPYFIGQHEGLCGERFVVIKDMGQMPSVGTNTTGQQIIDIIPFVPAEDYVKMLPYKKEIKAALKELNHIRKSGIETPDIADDDKKAYTTSIQYTVYKKLEG